MIEIMRFLHISITTFSANTICHWAAWKISSDRTAWSVKPLKPEAQSPADWKTFATLRTFPLTLRNWNPGRTFDRKWNIWTNHQFSSAMLVSGRVITLKIPLHILQGRRCTKFWTSKTIMKSQHAGQQDCCKRLVWSLLSIEIGGFLKPWQRPAWQRG